MRLACGVLWKANVKDQIVSKPEQSAYSDVFRQRGQRVHGCDLAYSVKQCT